MLETVFCDNCGEEIDVTETVGVGSEEWCSHCADTESVRCWNCNERFPHEEMTATYDGPVCETCLEDYIECDHCHEIIHTEDVVTDGHTHICQRCNYDFFTGCNRCGTLMLERHAIYDSRRDTYYCEDCAPDEASIRGYSDNPEIRFFSCSGEETDDRTKFLGVELEVQYPRYDWSEAEETAADLQAEHEELFCKHDASIETDEAVGFEIVTHPCTVDYHLNQLDWEDIVKTLKNRKFVSHNAEGTGCGLHIHVSRGFFGNCLGEQDKNIAKLLYVVEKFWSQMLRLSRRTPSQCERWAARYCSDEEHPDQLGHVELLNRGKAWGKYHAINLSKRHTIEFRLWRGTLKLNTLRATIQLVDALTDLVVVEKRIEELQAMTWDDLRAYLASRGEELATYLEERGI